MLLVPAEVIDRTFVALDYAYDIIQQIFRSRIRFMLNKEVFLHGFENLQKL